MKNFKNLPSWLQWFWKCWLGAIAVLFTFRFLFLNDADVNTRFFIFAPIVMLPWLAIIFINMYLGSRLEKYLRKQHQEERRDWGVFGSTRIVNPLFTLTAQDFGDVELRRLKQEYKAFLWLALAVWFSSPFLFVAFMLGVKPS